MEQGEMQNLGTSHAELRNANAINNLPSELLRSILTRWSLVDEDAAWMASAVSRQWRSLVLSCPTAWSRVHIEFKPEPVKDDEWCIEEDDLELAASPRGKTRPLSLWLQRAGDVNLSLSVSIHDMAAKLESRIEEAMKVLAPYLNRLLELRVCAESCFIASAFMELLSDKAPHLVDVRFIQGSGLQKKRKLPWFADGEVLSDLWQSLRGMPALRSLNFRQCLPPLKDVELDITQRLHHLVLSNIAVDASELWSLLSKCNHLESLTLSCINDDRKTYSPPPERVVLPSLTLLSILEITANVSERIMHDLSTPNLLTFSLTNRGWTDAPSSLSEGVKLYEAMADFGNSFAIFARQIPKTRAFFLTDSLLPDRYLIQGLEHLHDLEELRLNDTFIGTPAFRALARAVPSQASPGKQSRPVLCPQLRYLTVDECDIVSGDALFDMVRARNSSSSVTAPLKFLDIHQCPKVNSDHVSKLDCVDPLRFCVRFTPSTTTTNAPQ